MGYTYASTGPLRGGAEKENGFDPAEVAALASTGPPRGGAEKRVPMNLHTLLCKLHRGRSGGERKSCRSPASSHAIFPASTGPLRGGAEKRSCLATAPVFQNGASTGPLRGGAEKPIS